MEQFENEKDIAKQLKVDLDTQYSFNIYQYLFWRISIKILEFRSDFDVGGHMLWFFFPKKIIQFLLQVRP